MNVSPSLAWRARVQRGVGQRVALEDHFRAVHLRGRHLAVGRPARHYDHGADAETRGVESDALGVVARAHGDDTAVALGGGQRQQPVKRAAFLE